MGLVVIKYKPVKGEEGLPDEVLKYLDRKRGCTLDEYFKKLQSEVKFKINNASMLSTLSISEDDNEKIA